MGTYFFSPLDTEVDVTRPYLLEIGEYCKITSGVQILTHDHARSVLRRRYGDIVETARPTRIGNNVFIGINSIVLPGVTVGDNVIIGAGSVVSGDIPADVVAAGNPCRILMSLEEYRQRVCSRTMGDAIAYARLVSDRTGREPTPHEMGDFFGLYYSGSIGGLSALGLRPRLNGDDYREFDECLRENAPEFPDFGSFLESAASTEWGRIRD